MYNKTLEISRHLSENIQNEVNNQCGVIVGFDWKQKFLSEINTNVDLKDSAIDEFNFKALRDFLNKYNFTYVVGLKNISYDNPSDKWISKLKDELVDVVYDEFTIGEWPTPIPEFDISENVFLLRYSFDPNNKLDELASNNFLFKEFMLDSKWKNVYGNVECDNKRIISLCNSYEPIILTDEV
jgi:hypothetical protein|tara:strand:- start:1442 stop:1990 length:549 start_codon:yes stop_codon:yes gene_type:complete